MLSDKFNPKTTTNSLSNSANKLVKTHKNKKRYMKDVIAISHDSSRPLGMRIANSNLPVATIAKIFEVAKKIEYAPISSGV